MSGTDEQLTGILLMDKPQGFTSHDVVAKLRGILHTRRIGHGGTLDPLATGVLPVFIGGATRAADYAAAQNKTYIAGFQLGRATDTQDVTGQTLRQAEACAALAQVRAAAAAFLGPQKQVPPMYSAVKIGGKKLYELARQGKEVERPARDITVYEISLASFDEAAQTGVLHFCVSKGTYVRTLINDLGEALGAYACMTSLCRTRAGAFALEDCVSLAQVERAAEEGGVRALLRPVDGLFAQFPAVTLTEEGAERVSRGAVVFPRQAQGLPETEGALCRVYHGGRFLLLGQVRALQIGGLGLFVYKNFR